MPPPPRAAQRTAGLVAFTCNLVVAAWIKFGQDDLSTPVLVTVTLALCLAGMGRSIALWAPHLFQRPRASSDVGRRDTVVQLGEEYGLPFAWHRVPKPVDDLVRLSPLLGTRMQRHHAPTFDSAAENIPSEQGCEPPRGRARTARDRGWPLLHSSRRVRRRLAGQAAVARDVAWRHCVLWGHKSTSVCAMRIDAVLCTGWLWRLCMKLGLRAGAPEAGGLPGRPLPLPQHHGRLQLQQHVGCAARGDGQHRRRPRAARLARERCPAGTARWRGGLV